MISCDRCGADVHSGPQAANRVDFLMSMPASGVRGRGCLCGVCAFRLYEAVMDVDHDTEYQDTKRKALDLWEM